MTEKQLRRLQRKYDDEMESAGLMTGRKLKDLVASNTEIQRIILNAAAQQMQTAEKTSKAVKTNCGHN